VSCRVRLVAVLLLAALPGCAFIGLPGTDVRGCAVDGAATVAAPGDPPLARVVAVGDFGTDEDGRNAAVATGVRRYIDAVEPPPERVLELGDNFYEYGLIGLGAHCDDVPASPAAIAAQALGVLAPWEFLRDRGIPLTAVPGNHDYRCHGAGLPNQLAIDSFLPPEHRWVSGWEVLYGPPQAVPLGGTAAQMIVLDSARMIADSDFRDASATALEQLLRDAKDRYQWHVLVMHHPLRTHGTHDGAWWQGTAVKGTSLLLFPTHALAAWRVPGFDELNQEAYAIQYLLFRDAVEAAIRRSGVRVAVAMGGHDHQLQLLAPRDPGLPHVLISGSGAKCSPVGAASDTLFAAPKNGFAAISVYPETLQIELYGTTPCGDTTPCGPPDGAGPHLLGRFAIPRE